jgi:hypothetical protein
MKTKMKLYFDKISVFHEGFCSGAECEYETENNSKTMIIDIPPELLEEYQEYDNEISVTYELRMKYLLTEEREQNYKGGLSGLCDKPPTNDERINFVLENWVCNENAYLLTRIELLG